MEQTILVTGVNGFVGQHVAKTLFEQKKRVIGVGHSNQMPEAIKPYLASYISCDLTDETSVKKIDFSSVDVVLHLASLASQGLSFAQPAKFIADNSAMTIHLFETAMSQQRAGQTRFIVISSGAVYDSQQPMPLTEESRVTHASPYAISKLLSENLCDYYRSRGFEAIVVRPFNHTGPGQLPGYLLPDLAAQIAQAAKANQSIKVGNLTTRRDYTDVRDVARAYLALATAKKLSHTLYNVCSGKSTSGEEILDAIVAALGITKPAIEVDQSKIRPNDPPEIFGSFERLRADTGWEPAISFRQQTITDYLKTAQLLK